jgi:hypothetical protein
MGWRGYGFVHHSRTSFCRAVPNLSITIRNFFIAVPRVSCRKKDGIDALGIVRGVSRRHR